MPVLRPLIPRLLTLAALLLPAGCVSMAPPIRANHYGAPGRVEAGAVEAAAGVNYYPTVSFGPQVGYGISDEIAIEGGAEVNPDFRGIGWLGGRFTPLHPKGRDLALTLDLETGFGAGVGGQRCVDEDGGCESRAENFRRPAGGAYAGLGVGGKIKWFWPWLRLRTQVSGAEGVPVTSISTAAGGVQFSIRDLAHIWLGTGVYLVANQHITAYGWMALDAGLSFTLATPRSRRLKAEREARAARR